MTIDWRFSEAAMLVRRRRAALRRGVTPGPHSCHAVMLSCAAQLRRSGMPEACIRYLNMAKRIRLGAPGLP
jgi:hypothetical protein